MKKLILYTYALLGCVLVSCNDSTDEIVDERTSFETDLYFKTYGFQTAKTTTLNEKFTYVLNIENKDAEPLAVTLKADEQILKDFNAFQNTTYKILPAAYYTLTESLELKATETSTPIVFNIKKIVDELGLEESSKYVVPLQLRSSKADATSGSISSQALINVTITQPTILFDEKVLKLAVDDTVANPVLKMVAKYNFDNLDLSKLTIQPNPAKVAAYNAANSTTYLSLPAGSYSNQTVQVDESKHELTVSYSLDPKLINTDAVGSYMLPVDFSSAEYSFTPESTIYFDLKFNSTKPVFEGVFDLTTNQPLTNDYSTYPINIDFAQAAALLKTTEAELKSNIVLWGIKKDGINFLKNYTADAPGYWFNKQENPDSYSDNGLLYVNYITAENRFDVGQFPGAAVSGGSYTVSVALVYNGLMVRYNITLKTN